MHTARFDRLIDLMHELSADPRKGLNMSEWVADYVPDEFINGPISPALVTDAEKLFGLGIGGRVVKEGFCGTVCCIAGHASLDPQLRAEGLQLVILERDSTGRRVDPFVAYDDKLGFDGLGRFFGIPHIDAETLFSGSHSAQIAIFRERRNWGGTFADAARLLEDYRADPDAVMQAYHECADEAYAED